MATGLTDQEISQRANANGMSVAQYAAVRGYYREPATGGSGYWYTGGKASGAGANPTAPIYNSDGEVVGSYPSGYGGGGGYGGNVDPTETDQDAAKILSSIANENATILKDQYENQIEVYDIADAQSRKLKLLRDCQARRKAGSTWYQEQQKLQSVATLLTDQAANALNSSLFYDFREMLARVDDEADVEILKTLREALQDNEVNLMESLMDNNNNRNQAAISAEAGLRQILTDWAAQLNNIHPDLLSAEFSPTEATIIDILAAVPAELLPPEFLNFKDFFDQHKKAALEPVDVALVRPDRAAEIAWDQGLLVETIEVESASDPAYWNNIQDESERKTQ